MTPLMDPPQVYFIYLTSLQPPCEQSQVSEVTCLLLFNHQGIILEVFFSPMYAVSKCGVLVKKPTKSCRWFFTLGTQWMLRYFILFVPPYNSYLVRMKQLLRFQVFFFLKISNTVPPTSFIFVIHPYLLEHSSRDVIRKVFAQTFEPTTLCTSYQDTLKIGLWYKWSVYQKFWTEIRGKEFC